MIKQMPSLFNRQDHKLSHPLLPGLAISFAFLLFGLLSLPRSGLFWDHFFHLNAGLKRLGLTPSHPTDLDDQPYGMLSSLPGAASYYIFHQKLGVLPADIAFNLPFPFFGALGVLAIYLFTSFNFGPQIGTISALFLALYPRYLGHSRVNPKDPLSAALICLSLYFFSKHIKNQASPPVPKTIRPKKGWPNWLSCENFMSYARGVAKVGPTAVGTDRLTSEIRTKSQSTILKTARSLFLASFFTALAFNTKINAIQILPILLFWLFISFPKELFRRPLLYVVHFIFYIFLTIFISLSIWFLLSPDPAQKLKSLFPFFASANTGYFLLFNGTLYQSNINMPWYLPLANLLIVTPLPLLILFVFGLLYTLKSPRNIDPGGKLLLLWFAIPTLKYLNSGIGFADDFRQLMEALYPLLIFAAIGFYYLLSLLRSRLVKNALSFSLYLYLISQILLIHPFEINYYSEIVGGIPGASSRFDTEMFGTSLKPAILYVNQVAPTASVIYVPIASVSARPYLRPDLVLLSDFQSVYNGQPSIFAADYVVVINRPSLFSAYDPRLPEFLATRVPIHTVSVSQPPLVRVFQNHTP